MYHARVWLNGELLGENIGGYLPFEFDVTGKLKAGQANVLNRAQVLRVSPAKFPSWRR
jgi:beta-galactosidase/beta-glucuronidase